MSQFVVAGAATAAFVFLAIGYWFGCREIRNTRVILTTEDEVAKMSRRTRAF